MSGMDIKMINFSFFLQDDQTLIRDFNTAKPSAQNSIIKVNSKTGLVSEKIGDKETLIDWKGKTTFQLDPGSYNYIISDLEEEGIAPSSDLSYHFWYY